MYKIKLPLTLKLHYFLPQTTIIHYILPFFQFKLSYQTILSNQSTTYHHITPYFTQYKLLPFCQIKLPITIFKSHHLPYIKLPPTIISMRAASDPSLLIPLVSESQGEQLLVGLLPCCMMVE